jgi:hypothetical protein
MNHGFSLVVFDERKSKRDTIGAAAGTEAREEWDKP